jgi:hypothetical protein
VGVLLAPQAHAHASDDSTSCSCPSQESTCSAAPDQPHPAIHHLLLVLLLMLALLWAADRRVAQRLRQETVRLRLAAEADLKAAAEAAAEALEKERKTQQETWQLQLEQVSRGDPASQRHLDFSLKLIANPSLCPCLFSPNSLARVRAQHRGFASQREKQIRKEAAWKQEELRLELEAGAGKVRRCDEEKRAEEGPGQLGEVAPGVGWRQKGGLTPVCPSLVSVQAGSVAAPAEPKTHSGCAPKSGPQVPGLPRRGEADSRGDTEVQ